LPAILLSSFGCFVYLYRVQEERTFPILMYHALWPASDDQARLRALWQADAQLREPGARLYALDVREFERQARLVAQAGGAGAPSSWDELERGVLPGPWITFDDGHCSAAQLALPVLLQLGLRAMFFVTTDWIGDDCFLSVSQIRQLSESGMLIGAHGRSHRFLSSLTEDELARELEESRRRLEEMVGMPVTAMSLPGGRGGGRVRQAAARAGFRHVFGSRVALASLPPTDPLDWPRIAVTNRMQEDEVDRIIEGDAAAVSRLAGRARRRRLARALLGEKGYGWVRSMILKDQ
jgi:peptidoglycan/xylan/chitin deacetylase (PgdA/CDA1 family)